ncbi:MAG TPA: diguanylate cyclase [Usitatibacteraceae bacterium]|nr:diguanylate cyclase [Usitatibacteraceae bacterium]
MLKKAAGFATRRLAISLVVFLLALGATALAWEVSQLSARAAGMRAFTEQALRVERTILERLRNYELVVHSGAAFFDSAKNLTAADWQLYFRRAEVHDLYPAIRGVHVAMRVPARDLQRHVETMQRTLDAEYRVHAPPGREEVIPVQWLGSAAPAARVFLGMDLLGIPGFPAIMRAAAESGRAVMSRKVMWRDESGKMVPGFALFHPLYAGGGDPGSPEARRRALSGYLFCPIVVSEMMASVIGAERALLDTELFDGTQVTAEGVLYDDDGLPRAMRKADPDSEVALRRIDLGTTQWVLYFESKEGVFAGRGSNAPRWLLVGGLLLSVALAGLVYSLLTAEAVALTASLQDGLTGLHNRRFLEASLKREEEVSRRSGQPVAIVQFDLDHFKKLNDTFGHAAGDEVLRVVGEVLRAATRGADIVCRYGGEEFTLILPGATREHAFARASTIARHLAASDVAFSNKTLPRVTVSGGIAVFPEDGQTLRAVLHRADHALLRAKREGRARVVVANDADPATTIA